MTAHDGRPDDWTATLCATGLNTFVPGTRQLAPCFQQLFLLLPVLTVFAAVSAYRIGRLSAESAVRRPHVQRICIYARMMIVSNLIVTPPMQYIYKLWMNRDSGYFVVLWPIDVWVGGVQIIAFAAHFGYLQKLVRRRCSHRGTLIVHVLWIAITILKVFEVSQKQLTESWPFPIVDASLLIAYGLTLLPSGVSAEITPTEVDRETLLERNPHYHSSTSSNRQLGPAQDSGNCVSRFVFIWVNPLIEKGYDGHLHRVDDLFQLPKCLNVVRLAENMRQALHTAPKLIWALQRAHGLEFYSIGLLRLVADISGFAGPLLLNGFLTHTNPNGAQTEHFDSGPYWYAIGLFATTLISAISSTHFGWRQSLLVTKLHVSLTTAIYGKSLVARSLNEAKPEVLNLMSTDAERVTGLCYCFHALWSIPFQVAVSLYILYTQVGLAFLAGLAFIVVLFPVNQWIVGRMNFYTEKTMERKDERVALCSEALGSVKSIKLNAWEDVFIAKISGIRDYEFKFLSKQKYFDAMVVYAWSTTKVLMSLLTFGMFVLTGHQMTAASTFTAVALLNMLLAPLNMLPWILSGMSEAWVSLKRIQDLIDLPSINLQEYYSPETPTNDPSQSVAGSDIKPIVFSLKNASFTFDKERSRDGMDEENSDAVVDFRLNDVNVTVRQGELVCLKGPLGGGKSSFLSALLARLQHDEGSIYLSAPDQGFGYVAQTTWLQRGTIRENIVWGADFDELRYQDVLMACALQEDLQVLGGDQKSIGEGGQTLSGGQRARIALARAVYQNKEIYLLDDVLSALDAHVASHIVQHCLLGLLRHKTRIIVTEHHRVLARADQILHVDNGLVALSANNRDIETDAEMVETLYGTTTSNKFRPDDPVAVQGTSELDISEEESKEYGTLSWNVFRSYANAAGIWIALVCAVMVILQKISENLGDLWLAHWVEQNYNVTARALFVHDTAPEDRFNLNIYAGLAGINSVVTLIGAFIFAFAGLLAAKEFHNRLLKRVFRAQFQFFDVTPLGRLLNRFSSDVTAIDDQLPYLISLLFWQIASLIAALIISVYALPWLALLVLPLIPVYLDIQNRYRYSSRDVKRLSSNALSPLYAHFTETLQGLTTIRAMTASDRFERDFRTKLTECVRAQLTSYAAENWLIIRLQFLGSLVVGGCGLVAAVTASHASNPGMVGLAISYALSLTELLEGVLYALTHTEQQLIAVERVNQYCELDLEVNADGDEEVPVPTDWPNHGVIEYSHVSLKYRPNLEPSLNDIQLEVKQGDRVGVAGRTGAGKSSLLAALFRVVPLSGGSVLIDSTDIATVPVSVLRDRIALVPQQPFLFSGSVRDNLDPRGDHSDSRIWQVIEDCLARPLVQSMGGLTAKLETNGSNLSAGQKQLLCLARALLKNSKIVCIDEGTANLDCDSERDIQLVLQQAFKNSTVLLIAHRITSLQNTNRVVVMHEGRVVEDGATAQLSADASSMFFKMLHEQHSDGQLNIGSQLSDNVGITQSDDDMIPDRTNSAEDTPLINFVDIDGSKNT